jgi:ATP-dependent HslUV protease ATP-binding subunit HslU
MPLFEIPGMPGAQMGMANLQDMLGKALGGVRRKPRKTSVADAMRLLIAEESDKLLDQEHVVKEAITPWSRTASCSSTRSTRSAPAANTAAAATCPRGRAARPAAADRGTTVSTKHGPVKTDHVLFIASGAFHIAKPSDLLPELQGRLPIRVELKGLTAEDFKRILTEPEASLLKQYVALLGTEQVTLDFTADAIDVIADYAAQVNEGVENIGARRLHTILERVVEEISYTAADHPGQVVRIDAAYVRDRVGELARNTDLSKYIL